jgi:hypothetical protein
VTTQEIRNIQTALKLQPTGLYDDLTEAAVRNFQLKNNLDPTGVVDSTTRDLLIGTVEISSDLAERYDGKIIDRPLPKGQYLNGPTKKEYLFLHHTAGWGNPYGVVDDWASDARGQVGTQYLIGGINPRTNDGTHDGTILRCFGDANYAWHLGSVDSYMHKHSIGIELCNFGWVTPKNGKFYTYTGTAISPKQVVDLGYKYRGYQYWQRYSNKQIRALKFLIKKIADTHKINVYEGLYARLKRMHPREAFEYYDQAKHGEVKGMLSHTSVRKDKFDVFPQPELVDMILSL